MAGSRKGISVRVGWATDGNTRTARAAGGRCRLLRTRLVLRCAGVRGQQERARIADSGMTTQDDGGDRPDGDEGRATPRARKVTRARMDEAAGARGPPAGV